MKLTKHELLLLDLWQLDKSPDYCHMEDLLKDKATALTREGLPPEAGKRWLTPRELIKSTFGNRFDVCLAEYKRIGGIHRD